MARSRTDADTDAVAVADSRRERLLPLVRAALADRDAIAFVHAGDDAHGRYLAAPAVVVTPTEAVALREPAVGLRRSTSERALTVRTVDDPAGAVARVVRSRTAGAGTVLTPRAVRHDVALFLERAGFDVASTQCLERARAVKTPAERDALRRIGEAARESIDAVRRGLAAAAVDGGVLSGGDATGGTATDETAAGRGPTAATLTDGLRVELAGCGVDAGGSRVWSVEGPPLAADRPIVVSCRPVGVGGLRLHAATTVVVDGDGGWERRASLALEHAHRAGRGRLAAALGDDAETVGGVAAEVRAELAAYGFENPTVAVHGVGCAGREPPGDGDELEPGHAVVVDATVERTDDGTASDARRSDLVTRAETLLLGDEVERLAAMPTSLSPAGR